MTTLKPIQRRAAAISAPLLLALSLTACGGGDAGGAPDDASTKDFCDVFNNTSEDLDGDDADKAAEAARDYADKLAEVGTPSEFSDEAREGFEVFVEFIADVDGDDVDELADLSDEDVFGKDDTAKVTAYYTEAFQTCTPGIDDLEGDLGDLEGDLPSDFPS